MESCLNGKIVAGVEPLPSLRVNLKAPGKNDSVLSIESEYWGGTSIMEWEILELNNQTLKHLIIKSENLDEE
jgi:hypothetical protein